MPDLVTHLCTALFPKAIAGGRHTGTFAVGVALPDLCGRVPGMVLDRLGPLGVPVPGVLQAGFAVLHMPVGIVCACVLAAWTFREDQRREALRWLLGGGALHLAADLLQDHWGQGYHLLFPLSLWEWEAELIGSEATVAWAPWLALVTAAAWGIRALFTRRSPATSPRR